MKKVLIASAMLFVSFLSASAQERYARSFDQPELLELERPARTFASDDTLKMTILNGHGDNKRRNAIVVKEWKNSVTIKVPGRKDLFLNTDSVLLANDGDYLNSSMMFIRSEGMWRLIRLESGLFGKISYRQIWAGHSLEENITNASFLADKSTIIVREGMGSVYALNARFLSRDGMTSSAY
jgi:hypothetical protein